MVCYFVSLLSASCSQDAEASTGTAVEALFSSSNTLWELPQCRRCKLCDFSVQSYTQIRVLSWLSHSVSAATDN